MRIRMHSPLATRSRRRSNIAPRFDSLEARQLMAVGLTETPLAFVGSSGNLIDMAPAPDGSLWIATRKQSDAYGGAFGRDGVFSVDAKGDASIVAGSQNLETPTSIVQGPDGSMWVASGSYTNGGRVTKFDDGVTTSYVLPGVPQGIAFDAAGKLWATVSIYASSGNVGEIIRLDPSSTWMDTYPIPSKPAVPGEITVGPDGSTMWFSDGTDSSKIGSITTRGVITEFNAGGSVGELAAGSDGNVWYATSTGDGHSILGSIASDGTVTPDTIGTNSHISSVIKGPDGNIWFADSSRYQFGRIDTTGRLTLFPDPTRTSDYSERLSLDGAGGLAYYKQIAGKFGHVSLGLDDPGIVVTATSPDGTEGALSGLTVARFTSSNPLASPADFKAFIDVGDASVYQGTVISDGNGGFLVRGLPDTRPIVGNRLVTVTVESGSQNIVGDRSISLGVGSFHEAPLTLSPLPGKAWATFATDVTLATLTDPGPLAAGGYSRSTVTWGDGTTSPVGWDFLSKDAQGSHYKIVGSHTYSTPGDYTAALSVGDVNSTVSTTVTVHVVGSPLHAVPVYANAGTVGQSYPLAYVEKAAIQDYNSLCSISPTVDWGDGTFDQGSQLDDDDLGAIIRGVHAYAHPGVYTVTLTLNPYPSIGTSSRTIVTTATAMPQTLLERTTGNSVPGYAADLPTVAVGRAMTDDLLSLRDAGGNNNPADFAVTVNWGDGSPTESVTPRAAHASIWYDAVYSAASYHWYYTVAADYLAIGAPHVYTTTGYKVVTMTVTPRGRATETYVNLVRSAEGAVGLSPLLIGRSQRQPDVPTVASFQPAEPGDTASDYTATVTFIDPQAGWGHSPLTFTGPITANANGGFDVALDQGLQSWGEIPLTVTVSRRGLAAVSATSTALITPAPVVATATAVAATSGKTFSGTLATFTVDGVDYPLNTYSAEVDWGDGSTSTVTPTFDWGHTRWTVAGQHTYSNAGQFAVKVAIDNVAPDGKKQPAAVLNSTATVTAPPPTTLYPHGSTISGTAGQTVQGVLASFGDSKPGPIGAYAATIDWGDGSTSPGTVSTYQDAYVVFGSHTYTTPGVHPYGVIVQKGSETPATTTGTISVTKPTVGVPGSGGATGGGPMAIVSTKTVRKAKGAIQVVVTLSGTINPSLVSNVSRYVLTDAGKDGKFGTKDDHVDKIKTIKYDAASKTVALTPKGTFNRPIAFRVTMK